MFDQDKRPLFGLATKGRTNNDDHMRLKVLDFQKTYTQIQENIKESQLMKNTQQSKTASHKLLAIGDVIFVQIHEICKKLAPCFKGLYQVTGCDQDNKLKIKHLTS